MIRARSNYRVLVSPANYLFADDHRCGETAYGYNLVKFIAPLVNKLEIVVGVSELNNNNSLPKNVSIKSFYKSRNQHPAIELIKYLAFPILASSYSILRMKNYDIIHHMLPTSPYTIDPLIILSKLVSKRVKTVIGPLQLHSQINSPESFSIMITGKYQDSIFTPVLSFIFKALTRIGKPFSLLTFKQADKVVCNFESIKDYYQKAGLSDKITVIPTGVDTNFDPETPLYPREKNIVTIASAGRLEEHKGHIYLLQAFKKLTDDNSSLRLILMGEGKLKESFLSFIAKNKLSKNVHLTGQVTHNQVMSQFAHSDVCCLPSLIDTNPVVIWEAMLNGLPVVATDVGAVPEMVKNAGIIVPKADPDSLYAALKRLVLNRNLRKKMGERGKKMVISKYSWKAIARRWVDLYSEITK